MNQAICLNLLALYGKNKISATISISYLPHRRLITDSKVKLKYQHLITNSFVEVSFYLNFLMACRFLSHMCTQPEAGGLFRTAEQVFCIVCSQVGMQGLFYGSLSYRVSCRKILKNL